MNKLWSDVHFGCLPHKYSFCLCECPQCICLNTYILPLFLIIPCCNYFGEGKNKGKILSYVKFTLVDLTLSSLSRLFILIKACLII